MVLCRAHPESRISLPKLGSIEGGVGGSHHQNLSSSLVKDLETCIMQSQTLVRDGLVSSFCRSGLGGLDASRRHYCCAHRFAYLAGRQSSGLILSSPTPSWSSAHDSSAYTAVLGSLTVHSILCNLYDHTLLEDAVSLR